MPGIVRPDEISREPTLLRYFPDATKHLNIPSNVVNRLPYPFSQTLGNRRFGFRVMYNDYSHTWHLEIRQGSTIVAVRKLSYGVDALGPLQAVPSFRHLHIVPFDRHFRWMRVGITRDNFANEVKLYYAYDIPPVPLLVRGG